MAFTLSFFKPKATSAWAGSENNCGGVWFASKRRNVRQPIPGVRNKASQYFILSVSDT
jgi:hypothetical protein